MNSPIFCDTGDFTSRVIHSRGPRQRVDQDDPGLVETRQKLQKLVLRGQIALIAPGDAVPDLADLRPPVETAQDLEIIGGDAECLPRGAVGQDIPGYALVIVQGYLDLRPQPGTQARDAVPIFAVQLHTRHQGSHRQRNM